eukprot:COSAG01_NODE_1026_length_12047_cov_169.108554_1_plen_135_part_10
MRGDAAHDRAATGADRGRGPYLPHAVVHLAQHGVADEDELVPGEQPRRRLPGPPPVPAASRRCAGAGPPGAWLICSQRIHLMGRVGPLAHPLQWRLRRAGAARGPVGDVHPRAALAPRARRRRRRRGARGGGGRR